MLADADGHLRQKLQQVLKLSKEKFDDARDHAMRAVVADNRMRIWYVDKSNMEVGLLFTCRLGNVDLERPVGAPRSPPPAMLSSSIPMCMSYFDDLLHHNRHRHSIGPDACLHLRRAGLLQKKAQDGTQTTMEATLMAQQTPAQREQVHRRDTSQPLKWPIHVLHIFDRQPLCCMSHTTLLLFQLACCLMWSQGLPTQRLRPDLVLTSTLRHCRCGSCSPRRWRPGGSRGTRGGPSTPSTATSSCPLAPWTASTSRTSSPVTRPRRVRPGYSTHCPRSAGCPSAPDEAKCQEVFALGSTDRFIAWQCLKCSGSTRPAATAVYLVTGGLTAVSP